MKTVDNGAYVNTTLFSYSKCLKQ